MSFLLGVLILVNIVLHVMHILNFKRVFEIEAFQKSINEKLASALAHQVEINDLLNKVSK